MRILPESQIKNLPILEDVLEELRLNVIEHLQHIANAKDLYSLNSDELKKKLNLLGLTNIIIGKFISLDLNSDEFEFISPEFYKMYRKLNQHRGNKMSMDYVFHSAGMMNTLVHSNTQFYNQDDIFGDTASFFDFSTFRDNQYPELGIGDGYIIVPYSSNKLQTLKTYLAKNPIIFKVLPAGYTFIFLSEYRTGYNTGVLQYDNLLNYLDNEEVLDYLKELYWEPFTSDDTYDVEEDIILPDGSVFPYTHTIYYYNPFFFRDSGIHVLNVDYPRYTSDDIYNVPLIIDNVHYINLQDYLDYYQIVLDTEMMTQWNNGIESVLNNIPPYKDIWLGDYLVGTLKGTNMMAEGYDHVKGMQSIQAPTYSYASLSKRGESLASQYLQRESQVISKSNTDLQTRKQDIISDRQEIDMFSYRFQSDYSLFILSSYSTNEALQLVQSIMGYSASRAAVIVSSFPALVIGGIDLSQAESYYNQFVNAISSSDIIVCVKDASNNIIMSNGESGTHSEESDTDLNLPSYTSAIQYANSSGGLEEP